MPGSISELAVQPASKRFLLRDSIRILLGILFVLPLLVWAAVNWFQTVHTILRYYTPLPFWDYWRVVEFFHSFSTLDVSGFWKQHNEHRIVFPQLIFATDMLLLHGRMFLPLAVSLFSYIGIWVIVALALIEDRNLSTLVRSVAILLFGIVAGWRGSAQVVAVPFQLQWTLTQFAVFLALYLITRLRHSFKTVYLVAVISCAVVANYSSANGLFIWPLLLLAGRILSLERRRLFVLSLAAVISISLFFIGYHFTGNLNLRTIITHPGYFCAFVCAYMSMPYLVVGPPDTGVWVGLASIGTFLAVLAIAARGRLLSLKPAIVLLGYYGFTLITAVLTAAGRIDPSDPMFSSARAARYVTVPLLGWAALISAAVWVPYRRAWNAVCAATALAAVILLFTTVPELKPWLTENDNIIAEQHWAGISIENGIFDPELARKIDPFPSLAANLELIRKYHLSIYSRGYSYWLGKPAVSRFAFPDQPPERGEVTKVFPVQSGLEVIGWAEGVRRASYSPQIIFVDDSGRIVGFGRRPRLGLPPHVGSLKTPSEIAWVGFINLNLSRGSKSFSPYVVEYGGLFLVPISMPVSTPTIRVATAEDIASPISEIEWQMDKTWTVGPLPSGRLPSGELPAQAQQSISLLPSTRIFSSWSGSDQNTGRIISSPISSGDRNCIVLPVLHGPSIDGESVKIVDSDDQKTLSDIPMEGDDTDWRIWRVPLNPTAGRFRIVAEDQGRYFGQWVAIGEPWRCR